MTWTSEKPSIHGWYWYHAPGGYAHVIHVYWLAHQKEALLAAIVVGMEHIYRADSLEGEFFGPIDQPFLDLGDGCFAMWTQANKPPLEIDGPMTGSVLA